MVREFKVLAGSPAEQLAQLAEQWSAPFSFARLYRQTRQAESQAERSKAKNAIRNEKLKFERLLDDLIETGAASNTWFALDHTRTLLQLLEHIRNAPEFVYAHSLAMDFLGERRGQFVLFALAAHTLTESAHTKAPEWRARIKVKFGWLPDVVLGRSEMRQLVYDAMGRYADLCIAWRELARVEETIAYLDLMSETDAAAAARARASEIANSLRQRLAALRHG